MDKPKTKTFKNEEEKLTYFDRRLEKLKLKKWVLENELKENIIEIIISDVNDDIK